MPIIRIPEREWGKVWRYLVKTGPISRIGQELIYAVSDRQIGLLKKKKLPFEVIAQTNGAVPQNKHG